MKQTPWSNLTEEELVPEDILSSTDPSLLCKWLSVFVGETRKKDGTPYPAKSLYLLLTGVLRHMRALNADCPNFLDTNDKGFANSMPALTMSLETCALLGSVLLLNMLNPSPRKKKLIFGRGKYSVSTLQGSY